MQEIINKTIENLKANMMDAVFVNTKKDALALVKEMLPEGASVACGGSVTLVETGVLTYLNCGKFNFLDRHKKGLTPEQISEIFKESGSADYYFSSSNAITQSGEL